MEKIFINKNSNYTLIMLHGTGGNEYEMAKFGERINSDFNILSIRGNIVENGMNRFFKRYGMGSYDIDNYVMETKNLFEVIKDGSVKYNFKLDKSFIIGFSNGANIALGLIQDYPDLVNNYLLLSPDYINKDKGFNNLVNKEILISFSQNDPYTKYETILTLKEKLINAKANVTSFEVNGHIISQQLFHFIQVYIKEKSGL